MDKKITLKQIITMCLMMIAIYLVIPTLESPEDLTNLVGSMGYSYEELEELDRHTVYVLHQSGYLVKTDHEINPDYSLIESVFLSLRENAPGLHDDVRGVLPASAVIRDYHVFGSELTLNMSESFMFFLPSDETRVISSLVWSMTELPGIERVHSQIEGEPLENLSNGLDVSHGLTRAVGINLEVDVHRIDHSKSVLLYFLTDDTDDAMLVPVTRLVAPTEDVISYAAHSLVRGPVGGSYISVFSPRTVLRENPLVEDGILTLNFSSELFYNRDQTKVSANAMRQLVMTMTEFEEVSAVSVIIEGSVQVFDLEGNPTVVPVSRSDVLGEEAIVTK